MSNLRIYLIDVGWGDSILLETKNDQDEYIFGLIDSNDTTYNRSSYIFIKRHLEKRLISEDLDHRFEWIMLSHEHADHAQGLKGIMKEFGTRQFWYPKALTFSTHAQLIRYANHPRSKVQHHEAVNCDKHFPEFGGWSMRVLWPRYNQIDQDNPNNNSIVLLLERGNTSILLTGDAEEEVWNQIANQIPGNTKFFKIPHHGSVNGTFDPNGGTPWLDACPVTAHLAMSTHLRPFHHPHQEVIDELDQRNYVYTRTDNHYHICFESDGNGNDSISYHKS